MQFHRHSPERFDHRRRSNHLMIKSIRRLHPLKALAAVKTETFAKQQNTHAGISSRRQPIKTMNSLESGNIRHQLMNVLQQAYVRSRTSPSSHIAKLAEITPVLPQSVSSVLKINDDVEQLMMVKSTPKPMTSTTVMLTSLTVIPKISEMRTTMPILLSRILSPNEAIAAKRARRKARWRKLGPLLKALQYPFVRRNLHRIVIADADAVKFSDRVRRIIEQRLQKVVGQQNAGLNLEQATIEQRPRASGILLLNATNPSKQHFSEKGNEAMVTTVKSSTTTVPTITTAHTISYTSSGTTKVDTKVSSFPEYPNDTNGIIFNATSPTSSAIVITAVASTTASSTTDSFEPKPFLLRTPPSDYHFRIITPAKKFKFTQKLGRQPRLRIRKPGDPRPLRGNQTASGREPLVLPFLAPIHRQHVFSSIGSTDVNGGSRSFGNSEAVANSTPSGSTETNDLGFRNNMFSSGKSGLIGFGGDKPPPLDFGEPIIGVLANDSDEQPYQQQLLSPTQTSERLRTLPEIKNATDLEAGVAVDVSTTPLKAKEKFLETPQAPPLDEEVVVPRNSGLLPASPPSDFDGEFGTGVGAAPFQGTFGGPTTPAATDNNEIEESIFTGESALTPNRAGPTGDGLGPPILSGAAVPPPVPAVGIGGAAAGIFPAPSTYELFQTTHNPPTTLKPSALLNVLNKADIGFNQAISHFEQGTPVESAAIDILEVALGSEKLDSQAKLLGHIDRTIGIDNLQRLQRWANTGGALDALKEQLVKIAKNYSPPENLFPTLPPQLNYLLAPSGKR